MWLKRGTDGVGMTQVGVVMKVQMGVGDDSGGCGQEGVQMVWGMTQVDVVMKVQMGTQVGMVMHTGGYLEVGVVMLFPVTPAAETLLRQAELEDLKGDKDSKGQYGPLTQRLIAVSVCGCVTPSLSFSPGPQAFIDDPASSGKTFSLPAKSPTPSSISSDKLEKRIKDELIALGLFDLSEVRGRSRWVWSPHGVSQQAKSIGGGEEDEVLAELKKKQAELKAVVRRGS